MQVESPSTKSRRSLRQRINRRNRDASALLLHRRRDAELTMTRRKRRRAVISDSDHSSPPSSDDEQETATNSSSVVDALKRAYHYGIRFDGEEPQWHPMFASIPNIRQQDMDVGSHVTQVPFKAHVDLAVKMHRMIKENMPDRICGICSRMRSSAEADFMLWDEIPNVELLRADVKRTPEVFRPAHVVYWKDVRRINDSDAPPPPEPVLPYKYRAPYKKTAKPTPAVRSDDMVANNPSATNVRNGGGAYGGNFVDTASLVEDDDISPIPDVIEDDSDVEEYLRNEDDNHQTFVEMNAKPEDDSGTPSIVLPGRSDRVPKPSDCGPEFVRVAYCLRYETSGANQTVRVDPDSNVHQVCACKECISALKVNRIPEFSLARLDGGDVPDVNHLGDPLPTPSPIEATIIGQAKPLQQLYVVQAANRPPELRPLAVKSHGIVFSNPNPQFLQALLPMRAEELAGNISVLSIDVCKDRAELENLVKNAKAVQVLIVCSIPIFLMYVY